MIDASDQGDSLIAIEDVVLADVGDRPRGGATEPPRSTVDLGIAGSRGPSSDPVADAGTRMVPDLRIGLRDFVGK